jgi:hypothetical protein
MAAKPDLPDGNKKEEELPVLKSSLLHPLQHHIYRFLDV